MLQRYWRTATLAAFLFVLRIAADVTADSSAQIMFSMLLLTLGSAAAMHTLLESPKKVSGGRERTDDRGWIEFECNQRTAQWLLAAAVFSSIFNVSAACGLWMLPSLLMCEDRLNRAHASYPHWFESYARWTERRQPYYVPPKTRMDGATTCELDDVVDAD